MGISEIIAIISVVMSFASTLIAALAISHSTHIQNQTLAHDNYGAMKAWFEKTAYIMKSLYLRHPTTADKEGISKSLVDLSASIDMGRLFFKNQLDGDYKINKPEVFRGRRVLVLDVVVLYFDIFLNGLQEENQDILWGLQRAFISEMIQILEKNKTASHIIEYDYIDEDDIIDIKNINNEQFRKVLLSEDIIKAVKERKLSLQDLKQSKTRKKIKRAASASTATKPKA